MTGVVEVGHRIDSYLSEQAQDLEASVLDLQLGRTGETTHAIGQGVQKVEKV